MTQKQIKTLVLFAQNYPLPIIAKKQKVSLSTIRERIKSLSINHPDEFNNALGLRNAYKKNYESIKQPHILTEDMDGLDTIQQLF